MNIIKNETKLILISIVLMTIGVIYMWLKLKAGISSNEFKFTEYIAPSIIITISIILVIKGVDNDVK